VRASSNYRLRIAETFHSLQGEGALVGVSSFFIRTTGCNLRCEWCDTPYTSWNAEGEWRSVAELVDAVPAAARHVVVTGGEPMLWASLPALTAALRVAGCHVTVETAGTIFQTLECDLMSVSPKLAHSAPGPGRGDDVRALHEARRINLDALARLLQTYPCQFKFVIARGEDVDEAEALLAQLPPIESSQIMLMPLGTTAAELAGRARWLGELCRDRGYRFSPRVQVDLWGGARGT